MKSLIRRATPQALVDAYRLARYGRTWYEPEGRPVREVFSEIYRRRLWAPAGGSTEAQPLFYSGPGSDHIVSQGYVEAVRRFIDKYRIISILDLGCGDFRVASAFCQGEGLSYHGVDIVQELIRFNTERYGSTNVTFSCRDILTDDLPPAQLCLIRQVLQHLSNEQVQRVLSRVDSYRFVIITEHLPERSFTPNLDIHHGFETRLSQNSGLVLDCPPFNRRVESTLCEVQLPDGTLVRSVLLVNEGTKNA